MQTGLLQIQKEMPFDKELPEELLDKTFVKRVDTIIEAYAKEVQAWRRASKFDTQGDNTDAKEPRMCPSPGETINITLGLTALQKTVLDGIISMLRVTSLDWTNSSVLKGISQLIKAMAPVIIRKSHTMEILAMKSPWALRCDLQEVLSSKLRRDEGWEWWDGLKVQPKSEREYSMDQEFLPDLLDGETEGNAAIRTLTIPQMRKKNTKAMQKAIDALMIQNLGAIKIYADQSTGTSPRFMNALKNLMHVSSFSLYK